MDIVWSRQTYLAVGFLGILLLVSMFFALQKPVSIEVDGEVIESRVFFTGTVDDVLEKNQIVLGEKDKVVPSLNSKVTKDSQIVVTRAFEVSVIADGKTIEVFSTPVTIKEAVKIAGISLGDKDIIKTTPNDKTVPGQEIEVIRVTEKEENVEETVPFQIERTTDNTLEKGLTRTIKPGKNGTALNTQKIIYHNGKEIKREIVSSKLIQEPVNKVIAMGTITEVSRGSTNLNFREARYVQASAYTYSGYRTASGKEPAVGLVAVDPSVIPMGTRMYVEGYGFAQAADTGGNIKGTKIDLFMETREQCMQWGTRTVKVYILD
jgi:uncharacterized protein YabE (DUF348 family)